MKKKHEIYKKGYSYTILDTIFKLVLQFLNHSISEKELECLSSRSLVEVELAKDL